MDNETILRDKRMKEQGATHKMVAWIHPIVGGDDFEIDVYFNNEPTQQDIDKALEDSCVKNDFRIVEL